MDIRYINDKFQFLYRTSSVILDKTKTKILLFRVKGRNVYLLPGGKVREREDSLTALKREIKEELGYTDLNYQLLALSEEFTTHQIDNHQINIIYYTVLNKQVEKDIFSGKEGEWCYFEWVDLNDLPKYNIQPKEIIKAIKNPNQVYHFINK